MFNVQFLLFELLTLASSEMIVRVILKEVVTKHPIMVVSQEFKARFIQLLLLILLATGFQLFLLHVPVFLILCLIGLTARLCILQFHKLTRFKNISKKLLYHADNKSSTVPEGGVAFSINHKPTLPAELKHRNYSHTYNDFSNDPKGSNMRATKPPTTNLLNKSSPSPLARQPYSMRPFNTPPSLRSSTFLSSAKSSNIQRPSISPQKISSVPVQSIKTHPLAFGWSNLNIPLLSFSPLINSPRKLSPPGIHNTGNICFLSSTVQCLASIESFLPLLSIVTGNEKHHNLIAALRHTLEETQTWKLNRINPLPLLESIAVLSPDLVSVRGRNSYQSQQDAGEFLLWLLDNLHTAYKEYDTHIDLTNESDKDENKLLQQLQVIKDDLANQIKDIHSSNISSCYDLFQKLSTVDKQIMNIRDMSRVYMMFGGQVLEARECQQCKRMSINLEYHTVLPLPVPDCKGVSLLTDCFSLFGEVENLFSENNMLLCSFCSQNNASGTNSVTAPAFTLGKRLALFSTLPQKLIIQLTRFFYDPVNRIALKNQSPVKFPVLELDLSPFTMDNKLNPGSDTPQQYLYNLTGFCVHTGAQSTSHGHYIAYTKVKDGNWYQFNDDHVTHVKDIGAEIESSFVSQNAYILFYTLK